MKLSVVIVSYNVSTFLEQCLHSVMASKVDFDMEVFVVDNASVDNSVSMVRNKFPNVNCIANKDNVGFSKANNQAIRIAKGEYVLLLNPDTVIETDTLAKVVNFMDETPDAGGLGVKMVDGKGNFLPESKRGLPTPKVSFFKMSGLSKIFPKSKTFNKYHLGYLDKEQIHSVEILSGAFMLLRKSVLDKIGLLDEDFFMYGEDIDLSYRILQAGYKNYYYPKTRIIHYKGESTKKGSLNYVYVFYNAMIIFTKKHFTKRYYGAFTLLIKFAIWLKAGLAMLKRILNWILLPLSDAILLSAGYYAISKLWENKLYPEGGSYPVELYYYVLPTMVLIMLLCLFFNSGYSKPYKIKKALKGSIVGGVVLLAIYSMLPEILRFSRGIVLFGALFSPVAILFVRLFYILVGYIKIPANKRIAIVGSAQEVERVRNLITTFNLKNEVCFNVSTSNDTGSNDVFVGNIDKLEDIVRVNKINEIVFCAGDLKSEQIIDQMSMLQHLNIEYKIAPPKSLSIIGSSSINTVGELLELENNSVSKANNKILKRTFDFIISLLMILTLPLHIIFIPKRKNFIANIFRVFVSKFTFVGYNTEISCKTLPNLKKSILFPTDNFNKQIDNYELIYKLNAVYAKDYKLLNDVLILIKGYKKLGRKIK
ncbi:MAG: glycosyltransferase [Bacteroidales bacterium]